MRAGGFPGNPGGLVVSIVKRSDESSDGPPDQRRKRAPYFCVPLDRFAALLTNNPSSHHNSALIQIPEDLVLRPIIWLFLPAWNVGLPPISLLAKAPGRETDESCIEWSLFRFPLL